MMMGPTKKKIIATGIVAFTIPVVASGIAFWQYSKIKNEEIKKLEVKTEVTKAYVFTDNLLEGDVITASDLLLVDTKGESAPLDSFSGDKWEIVGRRVRINAEAKTIVTESMLMDEVDTDPTISERYQEFNMFLLPSDLIKGDYIDIRITMPDGENYIVVSGKEVKKLGTSLESNTIFLQLDEEEIIRTTAAIIESYMSDGIKLYVTKYVGPSAQLYKSERVDFVKRFEDTLESLYAERLALISGDTANLMEYINLYGGTDEEKEEVMKITEKTLREFYGKNRVPGSEGVSGDSINSLYTLDSLDLYGLMNLYTGTQTELINMLNKENDELIYVLKDDITNAEIAPIIGLTEKQTDDIRTALAENDRSVLNMYNDKLVRTRLDMHETYPVKENIAVAIQNNPNILDELKTKYNVEALMEQRANLQNLTAYEYDEYMDAYTPTEALAALQANLDQEIDVQKNERKEYLQALLLEE